VTRGAVALLALAALAAGCGLLARPQLEVVSEAVSLADGAPAMVTIANVGPARSTLSFTVESSEPRVVATPDHGTLVGGAQLTVELGADFEGLCTLATATLTVRSNGGTATIPVTLGAAGTPSRAARVAEWEDVAARLALAEGAPGQPPRPGDPVPGQLLVRFEPTLVAPAPGRAQAEVARASLSASVAASGGVLVLRSGLLDEHDLVEVPDGDPSGAARRLLADPRVREVAPNLVVGRLAAPGDPLYPSQWGLAMIGAAPAWRVAADSPGAYDVVLAVVDDGLNVAHPDLAGRLLAGYDLHDGDHDITTTSDHGSHVAGIAGAATDNGIGIAGVATHPRVRLQGVKVFPSDEGTSTTDVVLRGIRWASGLPVAGAPLNPTPAHVINLSLGFGKRPAPSLVRLFQETVDQAHARGIVLVAAAGNRAQGSGVDAASDGLDYPACLQRVIAVGAVDATGDRASFSDYGPGLDVVAPGGVGVGPSPRGASGCQPTLTIVSLAGTGDGYRCLAGTSMAAPVVSGVAALLLATDPDHYLGDPDAVASRLRDTAHRPDAFDDRTHGAGIVCAAAALGAAVGCAP
jgi:serine protease